MTESLKKRLLTAIILLPLIILALIFLPILSFAIVSGLILLLAGSEWPKLMGKHSLFNVTFYIFLLIIVMFISFIGIQINDRTGLLAKVIYALVFMSWLMAIVWVVIYNRNLKTPSNSPWLYGIWGIFIIVPCWFGLNIIRELDYGRWFIAYLLFLVWAADSTAYFVGRKWGKRKLAKNVSPNKSYEGVYGAIAATLIISTLGALFIPLPIDKKLAFIILSIITVLFSIVGDLIISVMKRQQQIKDTGTLLPGHGGMLDRIDSLTASAFIFAVGLLILGLR